MSRTPAQGVDAIDRDAQYLMKIKRRVAKDVARDVKESQEIQALLVKVMGLLYKRTLRLDYEEAKPDKPIKSARKAG